MDCFRILLLLAGLHAVTTASAQIDTLSGPISNVAVTVFTNTGRMIAGVNGQGMAYSDDLGGHWQNATGGPVGSIHAIHNVQNTLLVESLTEFTDDVYGSTDNGLTYAKHFEVDRYGVPTPKVAHPDTCWYAPPFLNEIWRQYYPFATTGPAEKVLTLAPATFIDIGESQGHLIVVASDGIRWSADGGNTWQNSVISPSGSPNYGKLYPLGNSIYMYQGLGYMYRSDDGGVNWINLPAFDLQNPDLYISALSHDGDALLAICNGNEAAQQRVWRSTDKGTSWLVAYPGLQEIEESFEVGGSIIARSIWGLLRSDDNETTWNTAVYGLKPTMLAGFHITPDGRWLVIPKANSPAVYWSDNQGLSYHYIPFSYYEPSEVIAQGNQIVIAYFSYLAYSSDGGQSWAKLPNLPGVQSFNSVFWQGTDFYVLTSTGTLHRYRTANGSWTSVNPGGTVYAATALQGLLFVAGDWGVKVSDDGGLTWKLLPNVPGTPLAPFVGATQLYAVGERLFLSSNPYGISVSDDFGLTWQNAGSGMDVSSTQNIRIMEGTGSQILAHRYAYPLYASANGGLEWFPFLAGPSTVYNFIEAYDSFVYLGSAGSNAQFLRVNINDWAIAVARGTVYNDENNNGQRDPLEHGIPNVVVFEESGIDIALTDTSGNYALRISDGAADDHVRIYPAFAALQNPQPADYAVNTSTDSLDFGIYAPQFDLSVQMSTSVLPRSGFGYPVWVSAYNQGIHTLHNVQIKLAPDARLHLLSVSTPASQVFGDTLIWNIPSLPAFSGKEFSVFFRLDSTAVIGTLLYNYSTATFDGADDFPANNRNSLAQVIVGSYDPNDKQVSRARISPAEIAQQPVLRYTVRFQNTGNFPADFVRIRDTLSPALDPASFRLLGASHPVEAKFRSPAVLDFYFKDIFLPDSTSNETASHGFVAFEIRPTATLTEGDSIFNRAGIYFDYNPPVLTNYAATVVKDSIVQTDQPILSAISLLQVIPNPVTGDWVQIMLPENTEQEGVVTIWDKQGRAVWSQQMALQPVLRVPVNHTLSGNYIISVNARQHIWVGKVTVLK